MPTGGAEHVLPAASAIGRAALIVAAETAAQIGGVVFYGGSALGAARSSRPALDAVSCRSASAAPMPLARWPVDWAISFIGAAARREGRSPRLRLQARRAISVSIPVHPGAIIEFARDQLSATRKPTTISRTSWRRSVLRPTRRTGLEVGCRLGRHRACAPTGRDEAVSPRRRAARAAAAARSGLVRSALALAGFHVPR